MKRRILTFGAVLVLVLVMVPVVPGVVLGATTTVVSGNVTQGYTFTAPSPIDLGSMAPSGEAYKASSTDGSLMGNDPNGYNVTGTDAKVTNKGFMQSGGNVLHYKFQISDTDGSYVNADTTKTFVDTSEPTNVTFSLYVSQLVATNDAVATGYTITITFTVLPK